MNEPDSVVKRIRARIGGWDLPVMVLWAVTLFCVGPFVLLQVFSPNNRYGAIPVPIHSESEADYSQDPRSRFVPVISLDILRDLMLGGEDLEELTWLQTLTATYRPQEATSTPQPSSQPGPQSTPTPEPTQDHPVDGTPTYAFTPTPQGPTATARRTDTDPTRPSPTTESPEPSATTPAPPKPTTDTPPEPTTPVTPEPSETTEVPPTTESPTVIVHPTKTTPPPPTDTPEPPEPTNTPAPRPTNTPAPRPTNTPEIPFTPITFPTKIPTNPSP